MSGTKILLNSIRKKRFMIVWMAQFVFKESVVLFGGVCGCETWSHTRIKNIG